jgi:hypothetical protein
MQLSNNYQNWQDEITAYANTVHKSLLSRAPKFLDPTDLKLNDQVHIHVSEPLNHHTINGIHSVVTITIASVYGDFNAGYGGHEGTNKEPIICPSYEDAYIDHIQHKIQIIVKDNGDDILTQQGIDALSKRIKFVIDYTLSTHCMFN